MNEEEYEAKRVWIEIGDYRLWNVDEDNFGITHNVTGEMGTFKKDEFLPYVSSFFGLNF
jgi:hypothetical protein